MLNKNAGSNAQRDPPQFPHELWDIVIDHLHDDKRSLKACRLVCKAWTPSAHLHLFSELWICPRDPAVLSQQASNIFPFVRNLQVYRPRSWQAFLPLLVGLGRIRSLVLVGLPVFHLDSRSSSVLRNNFSTAALGILCVHGVLFNDVASFARLVCAFPRLRTLSVKGTIKPKNPFHLQPISSMPFHPSPNLHTLELECLGIGNMDAILEWFLALPVPTALRTLCLRSICDTDLSLLSRFTAALSNSLENLFLLSGNSGVFDLGTLTRLRLLHIVLPSTNASRHTPWITQMLSTISPGCLEALVIGVTFTGGQDTDPSRAVAWDEVDAVLQHPTFSRLRKVDIHCSGQHQWMNLVEWGMAYLPFWILTHMPQCRARGILRALSLDKQLAIIL